MNNLSFDFILINSGCYDVTLPQTPAVIAEYVQNACVNTTQISCMNDLESTFYQDQNLVGDCYEKCPVECVEVRYDLSVSASSFPTEWYSDVLIRNDNFNKTINLYSPKLIRYNNNFTSLKNALARVNVYYEDLKYTEIDESPAVTVNALLGVLGGNIGLFLGKNSFFFF